jgi:hypothetical protein
MLFHQKIIDTIKTNGTSSTSWHTIYTNWKFDIKEIHLAADTVHKWFAIKTSNDFTEFIMDNPEYGIITFDSQYRPRIIHAIKQTSNNTFIGIVSNSINSNPIEFELKDHHFERKFTLNTSTPQTTTPKTTTTIPTTPTPTPTPTNITTTPTPIPTPTPHKTSTTLTSSSQNNKDRTW